MVQKMREMGTKEIRVKNKNVKHSFKPMTFYIECNTVFYFFFLIESGSKVLNNVNFRVLGFGEGHANVPGFLRKQIFIQYKICLTCVKNARETIKE